MTARQRKARRHLLKRREGEALPTAHVLPEVPVIDAGTFDTPSTEPLPDVRMLDGGTFDDKAAEVAPRSPLIPISSSAFAITRGLRGEL